MVKFGKQLTVTQGSSDDNNEPAEKKQMIDAEDQQRELCRTGLVEVKNGS